MKMCMAGFILANTLSENDGVIRGICDVTQCIRKGKAKVRLLETQDKWFGVTYKEDKPAVVAAIRKLIEDGVYPEKLF